MLFANFIDIICSLSSFYPNEITIPWQQQKICCDPQFFNSYMIEISKIDIPLSGPNWSQKTMLINNEKPAIQVAQNVTPLRQGKVVIRGTGKKPWHERAEACRACTERASPKRACTTCMRAGKRACA
jgi:hypothetical protein